MPFVRRAVNVSAVVVAALLASSASAAVITTPVVQQSYATNVNLTDEGSTDWALWNYTANPIAAGSKVTAPRNRKANVPTPIISSSTTVNGDARGTSTSLPSLSYSFTDGANAPTTLNPTSGLGIVFDSALNTAGSGLSFTILGGAAGVPVQVHLYLTGFTGGTSVTPRLSLSLPGATTINDTTVSYGGSRPATRYTFEFTPDTTGDALTVNYMTPTQGGDNAHAALQAVTVSPVPEPSAAALLTLAGAALARRRRSHA